MNDLYFSRLLLTKRFRDLHDVHNLVWTAFRAEQVEGAPRPFLFRADRVAVGETGRGWKVLVQATRAGQWAAVPDGIVEHEERRRTIALEVGERLRFLLRANATRASKHGHRFADVPDLAGQRFRDLPPEDRRRTRGIRLGLRDEAELIAWLERAGSARGFDLERGSGPEAAPAVTIARKHRETWSDGGRHAVHEGVDFEGHLRVRDSQLLFETLVSGVGGARAFGFGLLSLAREI